MKLLTLLWRTPAPWKDKRAYLCKLAADACAAGDLALALECWRYVRHGDKTQTTAWLYSAEALSEPSGLYECANCGADDHPSSECSQGGHG